MSTVQWPTELSQVTLPKAPLLAALKACLACAPKDRLGVSLTRLPTGVRIRLEATDHGSVERVVACPGWQPGRYVGLNIRYLLQAVGGVRSSAIKLQIKDHNTPVFLAEEGFEAVIMPLRITAPPESQVEHHTPLQQPTDPGPAVPPTNGAPLSSLA